MANALWYDQLLANGAGTPTGRAAALQPDPYTLGDGVTRACRMGISKRSADDPLYRPLRIFARDPSVSTLAGAVTVLNIPYEQVKPGPEGDAFRVQGDGAPLNLDDAKLLIMNGLRPTMSDPQFRKQMVYAICASVYSSFRSALGRYVAWGFDSPVVSGNASSNGNGHLKLALIVDAFEGENAFYQKCDGTIRFGKYTGDKSKTDGNNLPGGMFFTALSHDVVAHEVTHALLDGLRSNFTVPSGPDVPAFHEAVADLVAFFQKFTYRDVVRAAIRSLGNEVAKTGLAASGLADIAEQFGQTVLGAGALRTIAEIPAKGEPKRMYGTDLEPHKRGSVLTAAVFQAFNTIFQRKTQPFIRLATNGTGELPPGQIPADLLELLAKSASELASQFLSILIRSIDYCPPVDINFGDFLRAAITADHDLVPDDPHAYREALIDAFRCHGIFPQYVPSLSEEALLWRPAREHVDNIPGLSFSDLSFNGDPQNPADEDELLRQARCLGQVVCRPDLAHAFGLVSAADADSMKLQVGLPCVQSIRASRRIGPDGQVAFDLVAEVTQQQIVMHRGQPMPFLGGSTVILGPSGEVRSVISKSVVSQNRINEQCAYVETSAGQELWGQTPQGLRPNGEMLRMVHS